MRKEGVVIERVGEMVSVQFERAESCKHCHACSGKRCRALIHGDARAGDTVEVELPDDYIVRLSVLTYGLPLVSLVAGLLLGSLLAGPLRVPMNAELFSALTGGAMLLIGLRALHALDQRLSFRTEFQPRIVSVAAAPPGGGAVREDQSEKESNDGTRIHRRD